MYFTMQFKERGGQEGFGERRGRGKPNGEGRVSKDVFFSRKGAVKAERWRRGRQGRYRRMKGRVGIYYDKGRRVGKYEDGG